MKKLIADIRDINTLFSVVKTILNDAPLSPEESAIIDVIPSSKNLSLVELVKTAINSGNDPLGAAYSCFRSSASRRNEGITLTPSHIVERMINLSAYGKEPHRIVDAGAGTGRFTLAAARRFPNSPIVAVEKNPELAVLLRANLVVKGLSQRVNVVVSDYRDVTLTPVGGPTLFIGNPPYVRHHNIDRCWKLWYAQNFADFGIKASSLAGLHLHFFLKTLLLASPGDIGCFITAAEWLDVGYGEALRHLLAKGLGGTAVYLIDKNNPVFDDALTSAAITCFEVGNPRGEIEFHEMILAEDTIITEKAKSTAMTEAEKTLRWSTFVHGRPVLQTGMVELGDYFKVQRGQVTGMNEVWIAGRNAAGLPETVLFPTVTKAHELISLPSYRLEHDMFLRRVIDIPAELSAFTGDERERIQQFLDWVMEKEGDTTYISRHRSPWWRVNLKPPAPILMTYMGRRPPVFVRNICGARNINIAHGLYPRDAFSEADLDRLIHWLNYNVSIDLGRTYAGGLTKFEPGEAMRLPVPTFEMLREMGRHAA